MRTRTSRALTVGLTCLIAGGLLTGCTEARLRVIGNSAQESAALRFTELSSQEQMQFEQVLEGEIQTVYASDTGLARVYGQVANFSDTSYEAVQFDVVAVMRAASRADDGTLADNSEVTQVIGTFVVQGFAAGDIEPFDVQTTVPAGDTRSMRVRVSGVR